MARLVLPSTKYKQSFLQALAEVEHDRRKGNFVVGFSESADLEKIKRNFPTYIHKLKNHRIGKDLPKGYIPATRYWLVENGEFIGDTDIRHYLTKKLREEGGHIGYEIRPSCRGKGYGKLILKLALRKAKKLGINKALITCLKNNVASRKIIEANGGVLLNLFQTPNGMTRMRFWIDLGT